MRGLFALPFMLWMALAPAAATIVRQVEPVADGWQLGIDGSYDDEDGVTQNAIMRWVSIFRIKLGFKDTRWRRQLWPRQWHGKHR